MSSTAPPPSTSASTHQQQDNRTFWENIASRWRGDVGAKVVPQERQPAQVGPPPSRPNPVLSTTLCLSPQVKPSDLFGRWDKPFQPDPRRLPLQPSTPHTHLDPKVTRTETSNETPKRQDRPPLATSSTSESVFAVDGGTNDRHLETTTSSNVDRVAPNEPRLGCRFLATTYPEVTPGQSTRGGLPVEHPIVTHWGLKLHSCIRSCLEYHCKVLKPDQLASIDLRYISTSDRNLKITSTEQPETPDHIVISVGIKPLSLGSEDSEAEQAASYVATTLWHNLRAWCERNGLDIGRKPFFVEVLEVQNALFVLDQSEARDLLYNHSPELDSYLELVEAIQPYSPCLPFQIESRLTDPVTNRTHSCLGTVGLVIEVPASESSPYMIVGVTARHVVCGTNDSGIYRSMDLDPHQPVPPPRYGIYLRNTPEHVRKLKQGISYIEHGPMACKEYEKGRSSETWLRWQLTAQRLKRQLQVVENLVDGEIGELVYAPPRCALQTPKGQDEDKDNDEEAGSYCDLAVFKFHEPLHELLRAQGGLLDTRQVPKYGKWSLFRQHEQCMSRDPNLINQSLSALGGLHPIKPAEGQEKPPFLVFMHGASSGLQLGAIEPICRVFTDLEGVFGSLIKVGLVQCPHRESGSLFGQWRQDDNPDKCKFFAKEGDSGASVVSTDSKFLGIIVGGGKGGSDPAFMMSVDAIDKVWETEPILARASPIQCPIRPSAAGVQPFTAGPVPLDRMDIDTVYSESASRRGTGGRSTMSQRLSKRLSGLFK